MIENEVKINVWQNGITYVMSLKQHSTISVKVHELLEEKSLWETRESALEQKIDDSNDKIQKLESYWLEAQAVCKSVNEQLAETQTQYEALDKKYNKAKKLLKDYQQKWVWSSLNWTVQVDLLEEKS